MQQGTYINLIHKFKDFYHSPTKVSHCTHDVGVVINHCPWDVFSHVHNCLQYFIRHLSFLCHIPYQALVTLNKKNIMNTKKLPPMKTAKNTHSKTSLQGKIPLADVTDCCERWGGGREAQCICSEFSQNSRAHIGNARCFRKRTPEKSQWAKRWEAWVFKDA